MKCIRGEVPEYLPTFTWGRKPGDTEAPLSAKLGPSIKFKHREGERGIDLWDVPHVANNGASIPEPGKHTRIYVNGPTSSKSRITRT
jgi:hypothetical protein